MTLIHGKNYGRPALDLNFAENKSLIDTFTGRNLITFSRSQSGKEATYVGSDGLIKYAGADEPRFDYDPTTGESLGLLVEESRTNEFPYSEDFTHVSWTKVNTTVTSNATTAPDGVTLTADRIQIGATNGVIYNNTVGAVTSNSTISVWIKAVNPGTNDVFRLASAGDLTENITATNEWVRYTFTSSTFTSSLHGIVRPSDNTAADIYVWGAQFEENKLFPTSYIPTTGTVVTRAGELVSILGQEFIDTFVPVESGTIFVEASVVGEKLNTARGAFAGFGTNVNDNFLYFLTYDNRDNVGFLQPAGANVSKYHDLTGQTFKGATAWTDLADSPSTGGITALDGDLYGGSQWGYAGVQNPVNYDRFGIGRAIRSSTNSASTNSHIRRLAYWPTRLPDLELQQLTK
jgi:hypothetical protein